VFGAIWNPETIHGTIIKNNGPCKRLHKSIQ
jgi:hypothetical protein